MSRGDVVIRSLARQERRRRALNKRTFGFLLLGLTLPALACAQGRHQSAVPSLPTVAKTDAEKRVLSALDQMVAGNELYLAVAADNGRMLRLLAETAGAKNVVEIGTSTGYSALWICLALQSTGGRLKTLEIDPGRAEQARKHFVQAGVDGLVEVVVGDAHENVKRLKDPIDLLFLDADKEGYASYLKTLLPLVRPGGLIAADNVAMAEDYVKAVTTDPQLDTVFFGRFAVTLKKR
jgi:caffeoyl-CoA O-methyltransferase